MRHIISTMMIWRALCMCMYVCASVLVSSKTCPENKIVWYGLFSAFLTSRLIHPVIGDTTLQDSSILWENSSAAMLVLAWIKEWFGGKEEGGVWGGGGGAGGKLNNCFPCHNLANYFHYISDYFKSKYQVSISVYENNALGQHFFCTCSVFFIIYFQYTCDFFKRFSACLTTPPYYFVL